MDVRTNTYWTKLFERGLISNGRCHYHSGGFPGLRKLAELPDWYFDRQVRFYMVSEVN